MESIWRHEARSRHGGGAGLRVVGGGGAGHGAPKNHASGKITIGKNRSAHAHANTHQAKSRTAKTGAPMHMQNHASGKKLRQTESNRATPVSGHNALTDPSVNDCCKGAVFFLAFFSKRFSQICPLRKDFKK
jgi:hypothetical protein